MKFRIAYLARQNLRGRDMPSSSDSRRTKPMTATARVYQMIKNDILDGVYPPGTHLVRRTMAQKYGVSPLPILEACFRLENDGLVENSPMLGTHVVEMNEEIIEEEHKFREALECQAARSFAETAGEVDRRQIQMMAGFLDSIQEKISPDDPEIESAFHKHHSEFHLAVAKLSGVKLIYRQLKKPWFRRLMIAGDTHAKLFPAPKGWHATLSEGLVSADPDLAESCMRWHLRLNHDKYGDSVKEVLRRGGRELVRRMLPEEEPDS